MKSVMMDGFKVMSIMHLFASVWGNDTLLLLLTFSEETL